MKTGSTRFLAGLIIAVLLVSLSVVAASCGTEENQTSDQGPTILTLATVLEPTTWDPGASSAGGEDQYLGNMYETLVKTNPPGSAEQYSPLLATEWEASADGLSWTFKLREGVKFHDGTDFTAEAVKYSIDRVKTLDLGMAYILDPIDSVEVVDANTVDFKLNTPVALEPILGAAFAVWIVSPSTETYGQEWFDSEGGHECGTGPYTLVTYTPKEETKLERFADYWGDAPEGGFDTLVYKFVTEPQTQKQMLEAGEIDIALGLTKDVAATLEGSSDVNVTYDATMENMFVYLNCQKPPLDDVRVRQALSYATPYEDIITVAENGKAAIAHGLVPTSIWPGDEALPTYSYDLEKAKQLLAEAGYADGGLKLVITTNSNRANETQAATLMKERFAEIGIDVTVRPMPYEQQWALAKGKAEKRQDMFMMYWWPTYPDGYDTLCSFYDEGDEPYYNLSYWVNDEFETLCEEARAESGMDRDKSKAMYMTAQEMTIDDAICIYLWDAQSVVASKSTIQGAELNPAYPCILFCNDVTSL